ncbi:MAG: DNA polymerase beta superfamily protein [Myxococcota bacterium]
MTDFDIGAHTIFLALHGSKAYGTDLPESDTDYKGVAVPPERYFLGFARGFEQAEKSEPDTVVYDVRKFFKLAADCNPNIIEVLFVGDRAVVSSTPEGDMLRGSASLFLSRKARHTFSGYAHSQLKRIRTHRRWLLDPPKAPPSRSEYGLPEGRKALNHTAMGAFDEMIAAGHRFTGSLMETLRAEKAYAQALREWQQYERWKRSRNPARAELEARHGYDTKHAMHLVRLLRMCEEILSGKGVIVRRPDREELLAVRAGAWTFEDLMEWAEAQDARCKELYDTSPLPHSPDREALDALCMEVVRRRLRA